MPLLAVLLGMQPVATDVYLPALPALRGALGASVAAAQMTLAALVLAFGLAQLLIGPLADRFGRRPVLLGGLSLYVVAAAASAWADNIGGLVFWRAVQGVGLACAVVCARAVLRDLFEPHEGAHVMARALSGLGVIALVGPLIGALSVDVAGWRAVFVLCAVFGAGGLAWVIVSLPETQAREHRQALRPAPLARSLRKIAPHPAFLAWVALMSATYGAIYTYLAGGAFVFVEMLGVPRLGYGVVLASSTFAYLSGTLACQHQLRRVGITQTVRRGAVYSALGALSMVGIALSGWREPWAIAATMMVICFGHGHHQPCAQAAVTGPFPAQAGLASALAGFVMSLVAFGIGAWLGAVANGTVVPILLTLAFFAGLTALVAVTLVQRLGHRLTPAGTAPGPT